MWLPVLNGSFHAGLPSLAFTQNIRRPLSVCSPSPQYTLPFAIVGVQNTDLKSERVERPLHFSGVAVHAEQPAVQPDFDAEEEPVAVGCEVRDHPAGRRHVLSVFHFVGDNRDRFADESRAEYRFGVAFLRAGLTTAGRRLHTHLNHASRGRTARVRRSRPIRLEMLSRSAGPALLEPVSADFVIARYAAYSVAVRSRDADEGEPRNGSSRTAAHFSTNAEMTVRIARSAVKPASAKSSRRLGVPVTAGSSAAMRR